MKATICSLLLLPMVVMAALPDQRPAYSARNFHSAAIDDLIAQLTPLFADKDLAIIFQNCLPNTLDTTIYYTTPSPETVPSTDLDSFVITGDIDAMWLRDSMNQVLPYIPYASSDAALSYLIEGLINRQARSVSLDPFANAFNFNKSGAGHQSDNRYPPMTKGVFEGKYEIDSLSAFLKLSYWHWRYSPEALARFVSADWLSAVSTLLSTVSTMQEDTGRSENPPYLFSRGTTEALDTLIVQRRGPPCKPNGLTRSLFRPSDDAVTLPYNIPGNAMACVELQHLEDLLTSALQATFLTAPLRKEAANILSRTDAIRASLCNAVAGFVKEGVIPFEVDGFGSLYRMDDANLPSLLSLPVMGYMSSANPTYAATRSYVLSAENPYFFSGPAGRGIGGPHEGVNLTWPMAIIMQAMTSNDNQEIADCLSMLTSTTANTGMMHEAFNVANANIFTRSWFAWANGLFGELILQLIVTKPELVLINDADAIATAQKLVKVPISLQAQKEVLVQ